MTFLQKAATFRPFMGQFITLTSVASRATDNEVIGPACSAACDGYNMINVPCAPNFLAAIVAFTLLPFVLGLNIGDRIDSTSMYYPSPASESVESSYKSSFFRAIVSLLAFLYGVLVAGIVTAIIFADFANVGTSVFLVALVNFLTIFGVVFSLPFMAHFYVGVITITPSSSECITMLSPSCLIILTLALLPIWTIALLGAFCVLTRFAVWTKTIFSTFVFCKLYGWLVKMTTYAMLCKGFYSAPLSLYLRLLSADGEITRFSGATLADRYIITQRWVLP